LVRALSGAVLLGWEDPPALRHGFSLVLALLFLAGCSGKQATSEPEATSSAVASAERPSSAELRWVGHLQSWHDIATTQAVAGCDDLFDHDVGPAPSRRLRALGTSARAACVDLERGLADEQRALGAGDSDAIAAATDTIRRGEEQLAAALRRERILVPNVTKPLPRVPSPSRLSRIDPYLTRLATRLVGARTEVRCWSSEDWRRLSAWAEATAFAYEGSAHFATPTCARIARLAGTKDRRAAAGLLSLFSHELQHAGGIVGEERTECYGMQEMDTVGAALGLTQLTARRLQVLYWRELYELHGDDYRSNECRDGGALDLDRTSRRWP
jgi:hypothetical protein